MKRFAWVLICLVGPACAIFDTRPVQEMSDSSAAIRAAKEVQADVLAPELYRQAKESFDKARKEYTLKNFRDAKDYAETARRVAEKAEFVALKKGAARTSLIPDDPLGANEAAPAKDSNFEPRSDSQFIESVPTKPEGTPKADAPDPES